MIKLTTIQAAGIADTFRKAKEIGARCKLFGIKSGPFEYDIAMRADGTIEIYDVFRCVVKYNSINDFAKFYEVQ